jgi:uncharacterized protein (TIGR00369 family)
MEARTHLAANSSLVGEPLELDEGRATAALATSETMQVDEQGLVHGGFVFGLADYAAMLAVNDPLVVLGSASTKFLKPVRAGARVLASARVTETKGKKRIVEVAATVDGDPVFEGTFTCFVLEQHVLER